MGPPLEPPAALGRPESTLCKSESLIFADPVSLDFGVVVEAVVVVAAVAAGEAVDEELDAALAVDFGVELEPL